MKCEDCEIVLEEFFDGELSQTEARNVETHLASCAACARLSTAWQQEAAIYARYQRDLEVTPALWAGVEARLRETAAVPSVGVLARLRAFFAASFQAPRLSFAYTALLVALAIGTTIAVMKYMNAQNASPDQLVANAGNTNQSSNDDPNTPATNGNANTSTSPDQPSPINPAPLPVPEIADNNPARRNPAREVATRSAKLTPDQLIREAEQKYIAAIALLSRDVKRRRSEIDPITVARFDNALAAVDRTIQETKKAVRQNPNDPVALQYMLSAYAKKVDVLRELAEN